MFTDRPGLQTKAPPTKVVYRRPRVLLPGAAFGGGGAATGTRLQSTRTIVDRRVSGAIVYRPGCTSPEDRAEHIQPESVTPKALVKIPTAPLSKRRQCQILNL